MQNSVEIILIANLVTVILSTILSSYLIHFWFKQQNRMYTDLPLMFGITFFAQAVNNLMLALPNLGIVEASILYFRLRSLWITATVFPMIGVLVAIWLPRYQKYHVRMMALFVLYWISIALLIPTEEMIILFHMPLIILLTLGMVITFAITWKTKRLKEVRSELVVFSFGIGFIGQIVRTIPGLDIITQIITLIGTISIVLALVNPWKQRTHRTKSDLLDQTEHPEILA